MSGAGTDYTLTSTLGLYKPKANMAVGFWGDLLNSNADAIDAAVHFASAGGPFLPLAGATVFGPTTFSGTTTFTGPLTYTATGGSASRAAQDRAVEQISVKDFGAKGDGTTDDAAAFAAALAAKSCRRQGRGPSRHLQYRLCAVAGNHWRCDVRGRRQRRHNSKFQRCCRWPHVQSDRYI